MSIPSNRAVRGGDVTTMERRLNLRPVDMQWLLGANTHTYYSMIKGGGVSDDAKDLGIAQALILRCLDRDASTLPMIRPPRVSELYALCQRIDPDFSKRHFAVLLGRDGATGYRWLAKDSGKVMRQEALRWATVVWIKLQATPQHKQKVALDELYDMVILEASLLGYDPKVLREKFRFFNPQLAAANKGKKPAPKAVPTAAERKARASKASARKTK